MTLSDVLDTLAAAVDQLEFGPPVACVYNPLDYASAAAHAYVNRYGQAPKRALFVGMNPGPFGMAQTGVPFGDVVSVRDWLRIEAPVGRPARGHPKRPILGFACPRGEVSGSRLWGWARERFGSPERFFRNFFIWNYCPLCFMTESGANLTPDRLATREGAALHQVCDQALRQVCSLLLPVYVIGVGGFAEKRCHTALQGFPVQLGRIPHPSPASPAANRGWAAAAEKALEAIAPELLSGGKTAQPRPPRR